MRPPGFLRLAALAALLAGCVAQRRPMGDQCTFTEDCVEPLVCAGGACRAQCASERDCPPNTACRPSAGGGGMVCLPPDAPAMCTTHADCDAQRPGAGLICFRGQCVEQCRGDDDCRVRFGPGYRCDTAAGSATFRQCLRATSPGIDGGGGDADAGADAGACPDGGAACGGACVDLATDARHCGACGNDCAAAPFVDPARARCVAGRCDVRAACVEGRANCTGDPASGCETDLSRATSCGACGAQCPTTRPACVASSAGDGGARTYACAASCPPPAVSCGDACADTRTDPAHCGRCGNACPTAPGSVARCAAGACGRECLPGLADCDGSAANGCEADTRTSASHCGACGRACPAGPDATAACVRGVCALACRAGFGDCDGNALNGCEADLRANPAHCGRCGNACPGGAGGAPACGAGLCRLACAPDRGDCDADPANGCETDTRASAAHCGGCGRQCPARANSGATCAGGACAYACRAGFGDCDGDALNGCEADLRASVAHCGACGRACLAGPGGRATCAAGSCGLACDPGLANCDGVAFNGCEARTDSDPANCGACGRACAPGPNADALCMAGACRLACRPGFGDCDASPANGCEAALASDPANCGACGRACRAPNATGTCAMGFCGFACSAGFGDCDGFPGNGCETSTASDVNHCGMCRVTCVPPGPGGRATCAMGSCGVACDPGYTLSGGQCLGPPPRQLAPLSGMDAAGPTVMLRWEPPAGMFGPTRVQVCRDRACTMVEHDAMAPEFFTPPMLAPGAHYWRVQRGMGGASEWSPVWEFFAGTRSFMMPPMSTSSAWYLAPDVNADGLRDLVVAESSGGPTRLYLGGAAGLSNTAAATFGVGAAVDHAGDVDGDGYGDLVAGDPMGCMGTNSVRVHFGAPAGLRVATQVVCAPAGAIGFGQHVAGLGDANGDGYGDVAVAPCGRPPMMRGVCVYLGSAAGLRATPIVLDAPAGLPDFGVPLAGAGDVNGDGLGDLYVGTCAEGALGCPGEAFVFLGHRAGPSSPRYQRVARPDRGQEFGAVAGGGADVNGDGYADLVLGASAAAPDASLHVYHGGPMGLAPAPSRSIAGASRNVWHAIEAVGDVNADGFGDVVASNADAPGHAALFLGGAMGLPVAAAATVTRADLTGFGASVAGGGSFDGSPALEFAIGAPGSEAVVLYGYDPMAMGFALRASLAAPAGTLGFGRRVR